MNTIPNGTMTSLGNMDQQKTGSQVGHNSSGIKRAHESSDSNKEQPLTIEEEVSEDMQIVSLKANNKVWVKVASKKGKGDTSFP